MAVPSTQPATALAAPARREWRVVVTLAALTLLGFALRAYWLDHESIWTDEAMSIRVARWSFAGIATFTAHDVHPPLYYVALHVWMLLFGTSVAAVRLLSAVFGAATIPLLYRAGARVFDRTTGLVAAVLFAAAPFHVAYGQEARMYSLLALLSLWSMYSSFRLLRGEGRRVTVAACAVSTALMLYTHVYGVFVVAAEISGAALLFLFDRTTFRRAWKSFLAAVALAFLLYLPWLIVLVGQVSQVEQNYWISRPDLVAISSTISQYSGSWALSKMLRLLALIGAVLGVLGWPRGRGAVRWTTTTVLAWMACPLVIPWGISQVSTPIFLARCTIAASVAFYLLAARGVAIVPGRLVRVALVAVIVVLDASALHGYFGTVVKDQWREAAAGIGRLARPGDLLLFDRAYGQMPFDYYSTRHDLREAPCLEVPETVPASEIANRIDRLIEGRDRVWLVVSNADRIVPIALDRLGRGRTLERTERWHGIRAYLFTSPHPLAISSSSARALSRISRIRSTSSGRSLAWLIAWNVAFMIPASGAAITAVSGPIHRDQSSQCPARLQMRRTASASRCTSLRPASVSL